MTGMKHQRDFGGPGNDLFLDQTSSYIAYLYFI